MFKNQSHHSGARVKLYHISTTINQHYTININEWDTKVDKVDP